MNRTRDELLQMTGEQLEQVCLELLVEAKTLQKTYERITAKLQVRVEHNFLSELQAVEVSTDLLMYSDTAQRGHLTLLSELCWKAAQQPDQREELVDMILVFQKYNNTLKLTLGEIEMKLATPESPGMVRTPPPPPPPPPWWKFW